MTELKKQNPQGDKLKKETREIFENYISLDAKFPVSLLLY